MLPSPARETVRASISPTRSKEAIADLASILRVLGMPNGRKYVERMYFTHSSLDRAVSRLSAARRAGCGGRYACKVQPLCTFSGLFPEHGPCYADAYIAETAAYPRTAMRKEERLTIDSSARYVIHVLGYLSEDWSDRLGGVQVRSSREPGEQPVTELSGEFADQAALSGLLNTLYDLGLPLLSVKCL